MAPDRSHALYRFYDAAGALLYIGITVNPGTRWSQHSKDKAWWEDVAQATVERFPDRKSVLDAERTAIIREQPRHNVAHNRDRLSQPVMPPAATSASAHRPYSDKENLWRYQLRRHDSPHERPLYLGWEVNGSALSDEYLPSEISAGDLLMLWVNNLERRQRLGDGVLPIYWSLLPIHESAPHQSAPMEFDENFLTYFTRPRNAHSDEPINWLRLPVLDSLWDDEHNDKGGFIQSALGWKPSPLQAHVDLRQLLAASGRAIPSALRREVL